MLEVGGPPKGASENEEIDLELQNERQLKKDVISIVKNYDWEQELDPEKIQDLFKNIDLFEGMRRTKRREAMQRRKENVMKLREG